MTQKKFFQIAVMVVGFVWVFCGTFAVALTVKKAPDRNIPVTAPLATTTTNPFQNPGTVFTSTPAPTQNTLPYSTPVASEPTGVPVVSSTTPPSTTQPTTATVANFPQGKEAIVAAYINGVNNLKNTPNFILNKNDTLNIVIDDMTGGIEGLANTLIPKPNPESYTFLGGVDSASGKSPNAVIAPLNVAARVDLNAVTSAASQQNADGGYTLQLILAEENQTLTTPAPNLSTMVQVIDVSSFLPGAITLTEVNINYAPSTITAVFDSQNRIVSMQHKLVSQGGGSGGMGFIKASMTMHGDYTSDYAIVYG